MSEWRQLSDPPTDDDHYLVWCAAWGYEVQYFDGEFAAMGFNGSHDPTHWTKLPAPPGERERGRGTGGE